MAIIIVIDCKKEGCIEIFAYALSIFNKSPTFGNIGVFKDLNIIQMGVQKDDLC